MRLLTVSHFYEAHGGGIERVAAHLCREFVKADVDTIWAASDSDTPPEDGFELLPLRCINITERLTGLPMPVPLWSSIKSIAREIRRCDAIIIHDSLYVTSIIAMLIAKRLNRPVVLIQHIAAIPFSSRLLRGVMALTNFFITRPMLKSANHLVFISDTVRRELLASSKRRDYHLIFNGVDASVFHPPEHAPKTGAFLPKHTRQILFVGRYVEKKGLAVIRELARERPDLFFLLAGSGPIIPKAWNLPNVWDLGQLSRNDLAVVYRASDLLLLPSVGEGYPLVIQEAMACGLPVVCGSPIERADPEAALWLHGVEVDLSDPHASARRCARAIDCIELTTEQRNAMAAYAARRYSWHAMAKAVLACLR